MKFFRITAFAILLGHASAYALTPAQSVGAIQLWITGSSAATKSVFQTAISLCRGVSYPDNSRPVPIILTNPGALDVHMYLESTGLEPGESSGDRVAYACTMQTRDGRAGALENQKVVIYHTVGRGSFDAYSPALRRVGDTNVNLPTQISRITEVTDLGPGCGAQGGGNGVATAVSIWGTTNNIQRYNNCARTDVTLPTPALPTGGANVIGDTGPRQSAGGFANMEYTVSQLTVGVTTGLALIGSEASINTGLAYGVATSYPLYYQLQLNDVVAGNLSAATCTTGFTTAAPNLTATCQPSIAAATYSAIANVSTSGGVNASLFGGPVDGKVNFVRRQPTSGTQSASNIRFLNAPCARGEAGGELTPTRFVDSTSTLKVTEKFNADQVKLELNTATFRGEFGLGIMSLDNRPALIFGVDRWAFVKLDGVSPNSDTFQRANAVAGNYTFWYEMVAFTSSVPGAPVYGPDLIDAISWTLQQGPSAIYTSKGQFLTPLTGLDPARDNVYGTVSKFTRFGNVCNPILQ